MNEQDRQELEQITRYQKELREYLATLERRITELTQRVAQSPAVPPPPPLPEKKTVPPPLPAAAIRPVAAPTPAFRAVEVPLPAPSVPRPPPAEPEAESKSFEMRVGTYWLVRIGVVILLTGLAFLAKDFVLNLQAAGKVTILYLLSGGLLGTGIWMARTRESMRNFGNVLTAGGLAAVYYTTYAAHYIEALRVIENPVVAGMLLLAWSAFMVWVADRRQSQTMALFAILLAYFTSIINPIRDFTLFSNLVLTAAGVFFLIKNRWAGITYASLIATYASYGFWRFHQKVGWIFEGQLTTDEFWNGTLYLAGYWTLFTVAVLWSKHDNFNGGKRAAFLTLNNAAFFAHVLITLPMAYHGAFWKFALIYGSILLALAWACRVRHPGDNGAEGSYLVQGLALVTAGIVAKLSNHALAGTLAAETIVLLVCGYLQNNRIMRVCAYLCAPLAMFATLDNLGRFDPQGLWLAACIGAALVFCGWWVRQKQGLTEMVSSGKPAYFVLLGMFLWLAATFKNTTVADHRAPILVAEALVLTFSIYALRMPEVTLFGQLFLILGQLTAIAHLDEKSVVWWDPALVIAGTIAAGHWWQHQTILVSQRKADTIYQAVYGFAVVGVLYFWLKDRFDPAEWLLVTSFLSVGMLFYGIVTRAWFLALLGQIFLCISGVEFLSQLARGHPSPYAMLVPVATVFCTALTVRALVNDPAREPGTWDKSLLSLTRFYRWTAMTMFIFWVFEYIPVREQFWSFTLAGFLLYVWGARIGNATRLWISGVLTSMGLLIFTWHCIRRDPAAVYLPNLLACLLMLAQQQIGKRLLQGGTLGQSGFGWLITGGVLALWFLVSRWVAVDYGHFALTGSWGIYALAVFGAGFALRERAYRLLGLGILGCAVLKLGASDIWKLAPNSRWITLLVLGAVLIVLGFVYNRFQEKIKSWL